ncbi:fimbrial protein [Enterobacter hormaechei]|uniref:fimbrial protein n=1 Tax=Enterobacter hormaechei TaxID=158836 RepID=UPI0026E12530|nr:fimbrial protein [Enterobacter hormaechei]MDO6168690.1 fimbrial protein [Enterobacter hormaechei]MDO6172971.1 fimbrial protein [Enterobacter hormaechei]
MKKLYTAMTIAALIVSGSSAIAASTGTILFKGEVKPTTCDITINGAKSPATVILPAVDQTLLDAVGKTASEADFKIELSSCQGTTTSTSAAAFFDAGSTVDFNTYRLKNTLTTGQPATNVQLELRDGETGNMIEAGQTSQSTGTTKIALANGAAKLPYRVVYYATGAATPGPLESSVNFTINYE